jgi:hypothetical protein
MRPSAPAATRQRRPNAPGIVVSSGIRRGGLQVICPARSREQRARVSRLCPHARSLVNDRRLGAVLPNVLVTIATPFGQQMGVQMVRSNAERAAVAAAVGAGRPSKSPTCFWDLWFPKTERRSCLRRRDACRQRSREQRSRIALRIGREDVEIVPCALRGKAPIEMVQPTDLR